MATPVLGSTMTVVTNPGGSSQRDENGLDQGGRSNQERQLGNSTTVDNRRHEEGIKTTTHGPWVRAIPGSDQQSFPPPRSFPSSPRPPDFPFDKDGISSPRIGELIPPPPFYSSSQPIAGPSGTNNLAGQPTTAATSTTNPSHAETRPEMLRYLSGYSAASTSDMRTPHTPGLTPNDFARGDSKGYPFTSKRPEMTPRDSHSSFSSRGGAPSSTHPFHLELTTKGRKRKRLAKACSACHKNKRRCDGFAPCSNCEFSSRVCSYLNSAGEAIPPPRTRETTTIAKEETPEIRIGDCDIDELEDPDDVGDHPQALKPDELPRPSIDLTWAAEKESQRLYDLLQDSRRASDKEAHDDRQSWLDAREKEAIEALSLAREGSPSGQQTGLGVDLNGDGGRGRTVTSGSSAGPNGQYSAMGQGAFSSNGNSRDSSSGGGPNGNDHRQGNDAHRTDEEEGRRRRGQDDIWYTSVVDRIDSDDALVEELCHQFFARLHPYQIMFHKPTFTHRRYLRQIPSALLHIMYALASRFVNDPLLLPPSAQETDSRFPLYARGEVLATRARLETDAWLRACGIAKEAGAIECILRRSNDPDNKTTWVDTEMAQAICLIGFYEQCMNRPDRGDGYIDMAVALLSHANPQLQAVEGADVSTAEQMLATHMECRRRVTWMLYLADISAATKGRPRRMHDHSLTGITLPGTEAGWNRHGSYKTPKARATFALSGPDEQLDVGEFGHIVRILSIFAKIMEVSNRSTNGQISVRISHLEKSLQSWASSLPLNWHFNNENFVNNVNKLNSPIPAVSLSAFCFAFAHALAESSQFYLQSAAAVLGEVDAATTARRQSQAVDNLVVTLDAIGDIGRHSPQMFFPLHIVSNWLTHTNASLPRGKSPCGISKQRELKLKHWWNDLHLVWGVKTPATPRTSNTNLKRSTSARQHQAPLPAVMRHSAHPSPSDYPETSKRSLHASPAINVIPGDVQLPPLRADGYLSHHQPERVLNIAPRKLSDLLDNAPSRHVITAPRPDVLPRGTLSNPTSSIELRHSRSPKDDRYLSQMVSNGLGSAQDEQAGSQADFEGRERKRPRLSDEAATSSWQEQSPVARTLSNEHDRPAQERETEKRSEPGMNGMAVLATAAAASR